MALFLSNPPHNFYRRMQELDYRILGSVFRFLDHIVANIWSKWSKLPSSHLPPLIQVNMIYTTIFNTRSGWTKMFDSIDIDIFPPSLSANLTSLSRILWVSALKYCSAVSMTIHVVNFYQTWNLPAIFLKSKPWGKGDLKDTSAYWLTTRLGVTGFRFGTTARTCEAGTSRWRVSACSQSNLLAPTTRNITLTPLTPSTPSTIQVRCKTNHQFSVSDGDKNRWTMTRSS